MADGDYSASSRSASAGMLRDASRVRHVARTIFVVAMAGAAWDGAREQYQTDAEHGYTEGERRVRAIIKGGFQSAGTGIGAVGGGMMCSPGVVTIALCGSAGGIGGGIVGARVGDAANFVVFEAVEWLK